MLRFLRILVVACAIVVIVGIVWIGAEFVLPDEVFKHYSPDAISGRIVNAETGEGIADAHVEVVSWGWDPLRPASILMGVKIRGKSRTDSKGWFSAKYPRLDRGTYATVDAKGYVCGALRDSSLRTLEFRMTALAESEGVATQGLVYLASDTTSRAEGPIVADVNLDTFELASDPESSHVRIELGTKDAPRTAVRAAHGAEVLLVPILSSECDCMAPRSGFAQSSEAPGVTAANAFIRFDEGRKLVRIKLGVEPEFRSREGPSLWRRGYHHWTNFTGGRNLCPPGPVEMIRF